MPNQEKIDPIRGGRRLHTWKEIGAFFGRDERTVKRWEVGRGLPVHRVPGRRGAVYAYASELEGWLRSADSAPGDDESSASVFVTKQSQASANSVFATTHPAGSSTAVLELPPIDASDESPAGEETAAVQPFPTPSKTRPGITHAVAALLALAMLVAIPAAMMLHLRAAGNRPAQGRKRRINSEAQEFYLKGEYYLQRRSAESLKQAVDNFTQAIVIDPSYAEAYAGLANCYNLLREYTAMPASEAYPRALAAARRAVALDDTLSGAHSSLAFVDFYWLWNAREAEEQFKRAIALDANSVSARHWYATFLFHLARFPEAIQEIDRAQELDPSSISILADKGLILAYAGRSEQGIALLKQLEAADPAFLSPHAYLATIYLNTGKYPEYLSEASRAAVMLRDRDRLSIVEAGEKGFHHSGAEGMFEAELARQSKLYSSGRLPAYFLAETYARLGRRGEALNYLEIACKRHEPETSALRVDPCLRQLQTTAEFRRLLIEAGFPQSAN